MEKQEKLDILMSDFKKLEESRKDYIRELTRKLADIHSGGKWGCMVFQTSHASISYTSKEGVLV
ncbi:MAG: hypothetical protein FWD36_10095 [Treponema sp.]|nr:hypothetical protein [Treponema sp.]